MKMNLILSSKKRSLCPLFIIGLFENEKLSKELLSLEPDFGTSIEKAVESGRFIGKFGQTLISYQSNYHEGSEVIAIGLGTRKKFKTKCMRKAAGIILSLIKERKVKRARIVLDSFISPEVSISDIVEQLAEISILATYQFDKYKSKKSETHQNKNVPLKSENSELELEGLLLKGKIELLAERAARHRAIAEGVIFTRNLINEPANIMNPQKLATAAKEMARQKKIRCEIWGTAELEKNKMGGILAVNSGSTTPPALIILEYGEAYKNKGTVCLIGKGVTFDTGGISIKPAKDMEKMKYDMSGAAAMISTIGVLADLKVHKHVVVLAPAVENNVAENPQRPGDIITMHNGKTVEVINTDAEGRLILGDALSYCKVYEPKAIIDAATLTGMAAATFGDLAIAVMGNDERLMERVKKAGEETGERCWELPMWDEYSEQIKGHHSDLYNVGGAYGGTITAGKFLEEFVPEKTPWVHLDIAGVAWANSNRADCPKGGTGAAVRLLVRLLETWK